LPLALTVPAPPTLLTEQRAALKPSLKTPKLEEIKSFKARPMPISSPFEPQKSTKPLTECDPFDLKTEERGSVHQALLQQKIEQQRTLDQEKKIFKSNPIPIRSPFVPKLTESKTTEQEPFNLRSEYRGKLSETAFADLLAKQEEDRKNKAQFKARPFNNPKPFKPKQSSKPLTEIDHFQLNSDRRATDRQEFDAQIIQKEMQLQAIERKRKAIELEKEREDLKVLRTQLVHRAQPVRKGKPVIIQHSQQQLTEPTTPQLRTLKRRRLNEQSNNNIIQGLRNI